MFHDAKESIVEARSDVAVAREREREKEIATLASLSLDN